MLKQKGIRINKKLESKVICMTTSGIFPDLLASAIFFWWRRHPHQHISSVLAHLGASYLFRLHPVPKPRASLPRCKIFFYLDIQRPSLSQCEHQAYLPPLSYN